MKKSLEISTVCVELKSLLPHDAKARRLVDALADLTPIHMAVAIKFARWLLLDPHHGLISLTDHSDVARAIENAAANVCMENVFPFHGETVEQKEAKLHLEVTKNAAWLAFLYTEDRISQCRINWMAATAVVNLANGDLLSAMHFAAVCWHAARKSDEISVPKEYYQLACDKIMALCATAGLRKGEHVKFTHLVHGDNTGSIFDFVPDSDPPRAIVLVDHRLDGVIWSIPVAELSRDFLVAA